MKSGGTVAYGATEQGHIRLILLYDDGIYRYTINKNLLHALILMVKFT